MSRKIISCGIGIILGATFLFGLRSFLETQSIKKANQNDGYQMWEVVEQEDNKETTVDQANPQNPRETVVDSNSRNQTKVILKGDSQRKKAPQSSKNSSKTKQASSKPSSSKSTVSRSDKTDFTGIVNINTATVEQLCMLKNIGESRANAIIEFRNKCGGFENIEEIKEVYGIGDKIFLEIKNNIKI